MGRASSAALALALAFASDALAQARAAGSRHLPVDHWAYEYIGRLRDRGYLSNLNPLVQPYRRLDVAQGLAAVNPGALGHPLAEWATVLREELAPELERLERARDHGQGLEFTVGGRASTSQRLDPLRPLGGEDAWPRYTAAAWFETGPFAAETRLAGDIFLTYDPDGIDPGQRRGGRTDNAYVAAAFPAGRIVVGRFKNNWAPVGEAGLMISNAATPYPQISFEFGSPRVRLRSLLGELDTIGGEKRYMAAHRLEYSAPNLALSVGEATLYARPAGGPLLRYLNPVEFFFFDQENQPADVTPNLMLNVQLWFRRPPWQVQAEVLLDDIDLIPGVGKDHAPLRYGFSMGFAVTPPTSPLDLGVEYQQVSSYAYRTSRGVDHYSFLRRGLGQNFADYDKLTVGLGWAPPVRGLLLAARLQHLRQGEGDFRTPFPADSVFRASPSLLLGIAETTYRPALSGRYQPNRHVWLAWDLGYNVIRNVGHTGGVNRSEFSAVGELGLSLELPFRTP